MAKSQSSKRRVRSRKIGTNGRERIKRQLLRDVLGKFDDAWAVLETGWRALDSIGEAGACRVTIGVGLEMYRTAYNALDLTILGMKLDGED